MTWIACTMCHHVPCVCRYHMVPKLRVDPDAERIADAFMVQTRGQAKVRKLVRAPDWADLLAANLRDAGYAQRAFSLGWDLCYGKHLWHPGCRRSAP